VYAPLTHISELVRKPPTRKIREKIIFRSQTDSNYEWPIKISFAKRSAVCVVNFFWDSLVSIKFFSYTLPSLDFIE